MPKHQNSKHQHCLHHGQAQQIPHFIEKLMNILEDPECEAYIKWTSTEDCFNIEDVNKFTDIVLPKYFKHNNFSSFIRQLNMYGFNKVRNQEGDNVYKNQSFKRFERELLRNIRRKINNSHGGEQDGQVMVYDPHHATPLSKDLVDLKNKQKNLENMCKQLISQNSKILEENKMMMKRLAEDRKEKNKKMEQLLVSLIKVRGNNQIMPAISDGKEGNTILSLVDASQGSNGGIHGFEEFLEDTQGMNRLQQAIKNYQSDEKKRNKSKNFTIVNTNKDTNAKKNEGEAVEPILAQMNEMERKQSEQENSVVSLGEFLNFEEPSNPPVLD